jgi:hypothetical protein
LHSSASFGTLVRVVPGESALQMRASIAILSPLGPGRSGELRRVRVRSCRRWSSHADGGQDRSTSLGSSLEAGPPVPSILRAIDGQGRRSISGHPCGLWAESIADAWNGPQHAFVLNSTPGFDVGVIHLLRDSRVVACSWRRVRPSPRDLLGAARHASLSGRPNRVRLEPDQPRRGLRQARGPSHASVRYEDLVRDPRAELGGVLDGVGAGRRDLSSNRFGRGHSRAVQQSRGIRSASKTDLSPCRHTMNRAAWTGPVLLS